MLKFKTWTMCFVNKSIYTNWFHFNVIVEIIRFDCVFWWTNSGCVIVKFWVVAMLMNITIGQLSLWLVNIDWHCACRIRAGSKCKLVMWMYSLSISLFTVLFRFYFSPSNISIHNCFTWAILEHEQFSRMKQILEKVSM